MIKRKMCLSLSIFFFKQKTAYEMRISDWSSDVCSSDLEPAADVAEKDLAVAAARGIAVEMLVAEDVDGKGTLAGLPRQGEQDEQLAVMHADLADRPPIPVSRCRAASERVKSPR